MLTAKPAAALAALHVHPAAAAQPVRQQKRSLDYATIADLDNDLQKLEWQFKQLGEAISRFRDHFNREVIPLTPKR